MKHFEQWHSERLHEHVSLVRWGNFGAPVLIFPTAGGDAEEIERVHLIKSLEPLLNAGKIKVYSCDSVAGRAMMAKEGSPQHRAWLMNEFHGFVYHEVVPAIRLDCQSPDIEIMVAGASIGAYNALAMLCRHPDAFSTALCLSGTYDLEKFLDGATGDDLYFSSPVHFIPNLEGDPLTAAQRRFVIFACGQGEWEDIGESWKAAHVLGSKGIPNRVDPWGPEWDHNWTTWRKMVPQYLEELTRDRTEVGE